MKITEEIKELNAKDSKSLIQELVELRKKMAQLKMKVSFRKLKNFHEITSTRKRIARVSTILNKQMIEKAEKKAVI